MKKRKNKYNINLDITVDLLNQQDADEGLAQAAYDRNAEAVETFGPWIRGDVLEVGCRHGVLFDILFGHGIKVNSLYGIDISPEAISRAKDKGYNAEVLPAEEINFDEKFDTVFCLHTLEHCINIPAVINGIYNSLRKGGHALIEIPIQKKEQTPTVWGHYYCFAWDEELIEMCCPPFKHIKTFRKDKHTWRRYVFQK